MKTTIKIAMAAALLAGASSLAMAQTSDQTGSTAGNAAASGGAGTHHDTQKTGSASSDQKIFHNQNGYQRQQ
jgi:Spy/CpxP family protein refolding chaperone